MSDTAGASQLPRRRRTAPFGALLLFVQSDSVGSGETQLTRPSELTRDAVAVDIQGMALLLLVFVVSSITLGWLPTPWWTSAIGPTISLLGGVYSVMGERPNYDMHGFGYVIGAVLGVACLVGWLAARGVRCVVHHHRNRGER